jgi:ABC-type histidine transport system ATPase subunit
MDGSLDLMTQTDTLVQIRRLKKRFGHDEILHGIDLTVETGKVTFLIGPSGSGKSTVLRCLNFLERPTAGEISFAGERLCGEESGRFTCAPESVLARMRTQMPMVFQHFNLFNHKTVLENVIEGPIFVQKRRRAEVIAEAEAILRQVGLIDKLAHYPGQLSGGQKQRVAIARAVAMQPKLILFDEPTSALDPELVSGILDIIRGLAEQGRTMVVVTHEMGFVRHLADKVHFFCDGVIAESGTPEELFRSPRTERLRSFMGAIIRS